MQRQVGRIRTFSGFCGRLLVAKLRVPMFVSVNPARRQDSRGHRSKVRIEFVFQVRVQHLGLEISSKITKNGT
jgi:hypothetical protein